MKRIGQKRAHRRSKRRSFFKRKGTVAVDRSNDLSRVVEMAEQKNKRIHFVSAALGYFVVICLTVVCFCHETHKEKIFFNGADLDARTVREVHAPIGGQAVLECEAGGTPAPLIHWLRNGQRIDQVNIPTTVNRSKVLSHQLTFANVYSLISLSENFAVIFCWTIVLS